MACGNFIVCIREEDSLYSKSPTSQFTKRARFSDQLNNLVLRDFFFFGLRSSGPDPARVLMGKARESKGEG